MAEALRYAVILEPDRSTAASTSTFAAFPHAHTQGDDVEDALRHAREVIELEIEVMVERGETVARV